MLLSQPGRTGLDLSLSLSLSELKKKKKKKKRVGGNRAMATSSASGRGSGNREGGAKAIVADQISQSVQSTSNLLHLMRQSSPSQAQLMMLPKKLLAKTATIRNTGRVLEEMPRVISSLDAHMETSLQSVPHLQTAIQLLANMESNQLNSLSKAHLAQEASD